ncbi:hypothetical protein ACMT1E_02330 [Sphingomonas flavalba]|uniref:hypothetical protein n=1 Tax=Sphingomonas flavalba TaxID=2559804 RepID=UPI0039E1C31A
MKNPISKVGVLCLSLIAAVTPTPSEAKKYDKCVIVPVESNGKRYIAVQRKFGGYDVTDNIPLGMSYLFTVLESGEYFCTRRLSSGINEFIDSDGNLWDFGIGASWQQVRG